MRKILLVDDVPDGREPLARLLRMNGYEVLCAGNGIEALEVMEQDGMDLVLLDLMMPQMGGVEVLERIRADQRWAKTPVIIFSASGVVERHSEKLAQLGVHDCLQKTLVPFPELLKKVEQSFSND